VAESTAAAHGVLCTIAYDGRPFAGFARQPNARTIAGELDGAVRAIDPNASLVRGSSRTDAGVHALAQRVAFDAALDIPPRGWVSAIAAELPREIAIVRAARVDAGFEPRHHARTKTYRYVVFESAVRDPFLEGRAWRLPDRLNHEAMQEEARALVGRHDFAAFRSTADTREDSVRHLFRIEVRSDSRDPRATLIEVEGDRFMHRMVRIIAGMLVDVGRGRLEPGAAERALASRDRRDLGITAPPDGLYLIASALDDEGHDGWPETPRLVDGPPFVA
jgi:tRNA pseudouridine38-40 synthase